MLCRSVNRQIRRRCLDQILSTGFLSEEDNEKCNHSRSEPIISLFGRPFVKRFALCYRTVVCPVCLSVCLSYVFVTLVYCGQTVGWIKMKLGTEVDLGPGHSVLDGDPAPPTQKGHSPKFRPMSVVAKWLDGSRCHLVRR